MPEPHQRLNEAMNERRLDLRLNWKQVAAAAGISAESLGAIRRGTYRPTELTARGIEDALGWERGGVAAILAGREPEAVAEASQEARPPADPQTWAELTELVEQDPEIARAIIDLIKRAQRIGGVLPPEEELEPRRHRDAG